MKRTFSFLGPGPGDQGPKAGRPWPGSGPGRGRPGGGDPPFWPLIFINGKQSHHNMKITYGRAKCIKCTNERCDALPIGGTTNPNSRWCKRTRIRLRVAERNQIRGPENRIFTWKTGGEMLTDTQTHRGQNAPACPLAHAGKSHPACGLSASPSLQHTYIFFLPSV